MVSVLRYLRRMTLSVSALEASAETEARLLGLKYSDLLLPCVFTAIRLRRVQLLEQRIQQKQ